MMVAEGSVVAKVVLMVVKLVHGSEMVYHGNDGIGLDFGCHS